MPKITYRLGLAMITLGCLFGCSDANASPSDLNPLMEGYGVIYNLLLLIISLLGFVIALKISKAFRRGRLFAPWVLITSAFGLFAADSMLALIGRLNISAGFNSFYSILWVLGFVMLLVAGYLYKKAVLR